MKHTKNGNKSELTLICKHCGNQIDEVNLIGFSLICPLCGKPQNGQPHLKKLHMGASIPTPTF